MVAPKTTPALIRGYIEEGRGWGHGEAFQAFIQLRRWNASPVSTQTYGSVPPFRRRMHFMSRSEWLIALLLAWIGCHVREQVPMWPWASPHLLYGYHPALDSRLAWSSGTLALCRAAGIKHGCFVGTRIPYIWTLDLVATMNWMDPRETRAAVVSVKPLENEIYSGDIDPIARGTEKLEIERRYSAESSLSYFVADRTLYPGALLGQLELYSANARLAGDGPVAIARNRLLEKMGSGLAALPPVEWRDRLVQDFGLDAPMADVAVQNIFWNQFLDIDLTREIQMEDVVPSGGHQLKALLRASLTADRQCSA